MPSPTKPATIRPLLPILRHLSGLTQAAMAERLDLTQGYLSRAEREPTALDAALGLLPPDHVAAVLELRRVLAPHPDPLPRTLRPRAAIRDALRQAYPAAELVPTPLPGEGHLDYIARAVPAVAVRPALEVRA
jgi:hypothetical protein